jgi:hypothetical protein
MMMVFGRSLWSLVLVALLGAPLAAQEDVVEVSVTGEGVSEDSARQDALRKALEQGGRSEIASRSEVDNYELIRDTIYARSDGIVTDYKILEQGDGVGGVKFCKIRAKVSKSAIASTWGETQNLLDQVGQPGVAIYINERIDGIIQDSSILESRLENRLLDVGFRVFAGEQVRAIADKESADAASEANVAKMQAIAKDFGTQIFITGTAQADAAGVRDLYGQATAMYNGDGMIKMFYTDTAELLASESLANWRGGARGFHTISPQAGKKALENAGEELVTRCYENVMRRWSTRISSGGEIRLEVEGMNIADAIRLKKKIQAIDPDRILGVNHAMTKGIATFRIRAKMTAETLVEHLVDGEFAAMLEVVDLKTNRIQAKAVGK